MGAGSVLRHMNQLRLVASVSTGADVGKTATLHQLFDTNNANTGESGFLATSTGANFADVGTSAGTPPATAETLYAQNGFTYEVSFESGCSEDSDCTANGISIRGGVDRTLSDSGAVCHPSGVCVCSSASYYGPGCTGDGRGQPKRSTIMSNSGDVADMEFDCSGLSASQYILSGSVLVATPNKIAFGGASGLASGDEISINDQRRNVIHVASNNDVFVDEAFVVDSISSGTKIFDAAPVYKLKHSTVTCGSTDQPKLATTNPAASTFSFDKDDAANHKLLSVVSGTVRDRSHINVGDRVLAKTSTTDNQVRTVDRLEIVNTQITKLSIGEKITNCAGAVSATDFAGIAVYKVSKGTTEALECSRRGLCNEDSGTCECFNGYTSYNCNTQNALAM